jgi:hypothetical protein
MYASLVVALIVLPALGFVIFSPTTRARFHLMRGNYAAVTQIYEKMLERHPERFKLQPALVNTLANIYLLMGRHDERAIEIYKIVQQLNLANGKREEIDAIVAKQYLTEGNKNVDPIDLLKNTLNSHHQKQNHGNTKEGDA